MEIKYNLTKDDYVLFYIKVFGVNKNMHKQVVAQSIAPTIIILIVSIALFFIKDWAFYQLLIGIIIALAWPAVYTRIYRNKLNKQMAQLVDNKSDTLPLGEQTMLLDEDALTYRGETVPYLNLRYLAETNLYFYFYKTDELAYIIPKRDLSKDEQIYIRRTLQKAGAKKGSKTLSKEKSKNNSKTDSQENLQNNPQDHSSDEIQENSEDDLEKSSETDSKENLD